MIQHNACVGKRCKAELVLRVQVDILELHFVAVQGAVDGLFHDEADEAETVGDPARLDDLGSRPLAGAPVENPALVDDEVHGAHSLLDGDVRVRVVAVDDVHVLLIESLE
ncbi:hypothetical protein ON010_g3960 [Phytophthora cinnamomi]|nr:hypothetical protein ON010_g3960 [Phytophthora cinnamomi]